MDKYDIVYVLKKDAPADELRYSLRSVCENLPHRHVYFVCGCPEGLKPDFHIDMEQSGVTVWQKSTSSLVRICHEKALSDDFWWFNDDFFVMQKMTAETPYFNGTLFKRVKELESRYHGCTLYSRQLERLWQMLLDEGYTTWNYAVHVPMLINKRKALATMRKYPDQMMFRSLYGNVNNIGGINHPDVKVFGNKEIPIDAPFLSTTETSFNDGAVGRYIRERFPNKCKYEV